ncbi:hypothetical protein ACUOA8_21780 [Escherichia sp. SS-MK2]
MQPGEYEVIVINYDLPQL